MKRSALFLSLSASALAASYSLPSFGAETAQLEQIIVTSRRTEESVQEVPIAVSALSAEALESKGIARMNDLVLQTPAVTSLPTSGRSSVVNFGIRGQRNVELLPTSDPSVIVYIADVPQMRGYGLGSLGSLDIQTVEVLKGPQGTLFGRSTTGGAIVITPNAPTQDLTASLSLGVGEYDRRMARAIVNVPITDTVAARAAVQYEKADGWIENKGAVGRDSFNDHDELSWRASVQIAPTDALTSTFYTDGFETNENGSAVAVSNVQPNSPAAAFGLSVTPKKDIFKTTTNLNDGHSKITVYGVSNTTQYELSDHLTIKNIAGYRYINVDDAWDMDGSTSPILSTLNLATVHQYSEELQFSGSALNDQLDWIAGLFWMKEQSPDFSYTNIFGALNTVTGTDAENVSKSVFAQGTYHITDDLNLTVGARANRDSRDVATVARFNGTCTIQNADATFAPTNNCKRSESTDFKEPSYNVTLDYHLDADQMVYAAHRHGYRSGGFNGRAAAVSLGSPTSPAFDTFEPFEPETVDDLELGYKGDLTLAGSPLRVNTAIFYSDYQEVQRLVAFNNNGNVTTNIVNAASAKLYGGEFEITWLPLDSIQVDLFGSYIHAAYDEWEDPTNPDPTQRDKSNSDFPVPVRSGGATVKYTLPTPAELGEMSLQGNIYAQAETQLFDDNGPGGLQAGYNVVGARFDWQNIMGTSTRMGLWGKNLNNTKYYTGGVNVNGQLGYFFAAPGPARSWGVDVTYDF